MIKWFAYIVLLLIMAPGLSSAKKKAIPRAFLNNGIFVPQRNNALSDTTASSKNTKHQDADDKKKIKEIAKARRQPKPEKIVPGDATSEPEKQKPKRQHRPEGLERPPEIPRRNDN